MLFRIIYIDLHKNMNFQPDINPNQNTITAIDAQAIHVNQQPHASSLIIAPEGELTPIHASRPEELSDLMWQTIIAQQPEVLLIGTGAKQQFITPARLAPIYQANIGVECMSSDAAARTYNVLMSEGRRVLALILLPIPQ